MPDSHWIEASPKISERHAYEVRFEVNGVVYYSRYRIDSNFPGTREQMAPQAVRDRLEVQYAEMGRNLLSVAMLSEQLIEAPPMSAQAAEKVRALQEAKLMGRIAARRWTDPKE